MKKSLFLVFILFILTSCGDSFYNMAFAKTGMFDESIDLISLKNGNKTIVFFPMTHVSTPLFFADVKSKIDSLNKENFYFYYEMISADKKQDTVLRKIRKIRGVPFNRQGYKESLDSMIQKKNIKLDKEVIDQPSYPQLGIIENKSQNLDVSLSEIMEYYESIFEPLVLEECDFNNSIYEFTSCKELENAEERYNKVAVDFRNKHVIDHVIQDSIHNKISIIYGRNHIDGMVKLLKSAGFK